MDDEHNASAYHQQVFLQHLDNFLQARGFHVLWEVCLETIISIKVRYWNLGPAELPRPMGSVER